MLVTVSGDSGRAMISTQVIYNVWEIGLGNSLNLQSVDGNCNVPDIAAINKVCWNKIIEVKRYFKWINY